MNPFIFDFETQDVLNKTIPLLHHAALEAERFCGSVRRTHLGPHGVDRAKGHFAGFILEKHAIAFMWQAAAAGRELLGQEPVLFIPGKYARIYKSRFRLLERDIQVSRNSLYIRRRNLHPVISAAFPT